MVAFYVLKTVAIAFSSIFSFLVVEWRFKMIEMVVEIIRVSLTLDVTSNDCICCYHNCVVLETK